MRVEVTEVPCTLSVAVGRDFILNMPPPLGIKSWRIVQSKGFEGYEPHTRPFLQVNLANPSFADRAIRSLKSLNLGTVAPEHAGVYDVKRSVTDCFLLEARVGGMDWLCIPENLSRVSLSQISKQEDDQPDAPFRILCIDVITVGRKIACISLTGTNLSSSFASLEEFEVCFLKYDPDIIVGYDCFYELLHGNGLKRLSRLPSKPLSCFEKSHVGSFVVDCPGRIWVDMYDYIKAQVDLFDYKLSTVARHHALPPLACPREEELLLMMYSENGKELRDYGLARARTCASLVDWYALVPGLGVEARTLGVRPRDVFESSLEYRLGMMVKKEMFGEHMILVKD